MIKIENRKHSYGYSSIMVHAEVVVGDNCFQLYSESVFFSGDMETNICIAKNGEEIKGLRQEADRNPLYDVRRWSDSSVRNYLCDVLRRKFGIVIQHCEH